MRWLIVLFVLIACAPGPVLYGNWVLVEWNGEQPQGSFTLGFGEEISGRSGCNAYSMNFDYDSYVTGPVRLTRMYCEGIMDLETQYLEALGNIQNIDIGDQLRIYTSSGVLVFNST